jgi:hypothetical protein
MGELRSVPDLLARSDPSFARTQHRLRTLKFWTLGIFGCLYVGSLVFYVVAIVATWRDGDWLSYWAGVIIVGPVGIGLARVVLWRDERADLFAPVAELRQAIRNGDETLAPVAEISWELPRDISADPVRIGPLRRPKATGTVATLWGIAVLVLLVPGVGVPLALGAGNGHLALLLTIVGLLPALVCILLGWRLISPLFVRIDPEGLRWRRPLGLTTFIAWRDANSFFSLTAPRLLTNGRETLYVLDGGSMTLAWRERKGADTMSVASLDTPSRRLHQRITGYTGLPLRDVTAQAEQIAWWSALEVIPTASRGAIILAGILAPASHQPKQETMHRFRVAGMVLAPFLALALVSLVALLVQAPYYEHLYVQAHSHTALYRDALTHTDGDWPDNAFSHFDNRVYHFQQSENPTYLTYVVAPHRYDRVLVEVSGRTGGTFDLGGVGLAISGQGITSPLLTFRVTPDGSWWIESLPKLETYEGHNFVRIGHMSAIHRGFGVENQIAVLINGPDFTFYVNGQYAVGYHDDALKGGEICLYLDVTSDSGDFSNFAVYPL